MTTGYYVLLTHSEMGKGIFAKNASIRNIYDVLFTNVLKIVGTGPLLQRLKNNAPAHVEFLGFKQGEELKQIVENAYFTIVPSEWYENNPLSVIESLAVGTPVIGSNIGGIPELINGNKNGFLFDAFQTRSLVKTIDQAWSLNLENYRALSYSSRLFAKNNCSQEAHYNKLINIYNTLL